MCDIEFSLYFSLTFAGIEGNTKQVMFLLETSHVLIYYAEIIQYIDCCIRVYIDIYASKASAVVYTAIVEPGTTFTTSNMIQALDVTVHFLF